MVRDALRRCRVCRTPNPVSKLQRWTVQAGQLVADGNRKATGRGYYSCSERCAEILPKTIKSVKKA